VAKVREPWELLYDAVRIVERPTPIIAPLATDAELEEVEQRLGSPPPHSCRVFLRRFGTGGIQRWVRLYPLTPRPRGRATIAERTRKVRAFWTKHPASSSNADWLAGLGYFASDVGGNEYAWDPADPTRADPKEYRFYDLPRLHEDQLVGAGDSFWQFIEWVMADVRSWRDPDLVADDGRGVLFEPACLQAKKAPKKRNAE
jgi:hypothetical protein